MKSENSHSVALYKNKLIKWREFQGHVDHVYRNILDKQSSDYGCRKVINLCEDYYHFLVLFAANMQAGLTTVMPSNRSAGEIARLREINKGALVVSDDTIENIIQNASTEVSELQLFDLDKIPNASVVAELYSSGSESFPTANELSWRHMKAGARQVFERFQIDPTGPLSIVATVPPQHMFGFEMAIVFPLVCHATIYHQQPFYPGDIQQALSLVPTPPMLVTTPTQLKACVTMKEPWPEMKFILSATSPMPEFIAGNAETNMGASVMEIYGCSEVGAIATRQTTVSQNWELLPRYSWHKNEDGMFLSIVDQDQPIDIPDRVALSSPRLFKLIGRHSDLIKIGGKRGSLAQISMRIKEIEGVDDVVVFIPEQNDEKRMRPAALVVAPGLTMEQIRQALKFSLDPVFLPRPVYMVDKLPYNTIGKLPRMNIMSVYSKLLKGQATC